MAEFLNWKHSKNKVPDGPVPPGESGFSAMGKPVPVHRRLAADEHCKIMGLTDTTQRFTLIQRMSDALERDEPYRAMQEGMKYLDLTGTYRLMAVLLTAEKEK